MIPLRVEQPLLFHSAIERGFGVIALESDNRQGNRWEDGDPLFFHDSDDTVNAKALHDSGIYDPNTRPVFAARFSQSGAFVSKLSLRTSPGIDADPDVSSTVPVRAMAIYSARGTEAVNDSRYAIPTISNIGINDNRAPALLADDPRMGAVPPDPTISVYLDEIGPYPPMDSVQFQHERLAPMEIDTQMNVKCDEAADARPPRPCSRPESR